MKRGMTLKELKQLASNKKIKILKPKPEKIPKHHEKDRYYILQEETRRRLGIWMD